MNIYLILLLVLWYFAGFYGGWLLFWQHQISWRRSFDSKPAMTMLDAFFILVLFPLAGIVSLIMGAVLYTQAQRRNY